LLNSEKIVRLRKQRGWDQKALAKTAGIDQAVVSRIERGIQKDFKLSVVVAIANAFEIEVDDLLNDEFKHTIHLLTPELKSAISRLGKASPQIQNRIAAIIESYLSALQQEINS